MAAPIFWSLSLLQTQMIMEAWNPLDTQLIPALATDCQCQKWEGGEPIWPNKATQIGTAGR
jgi:hypothetical protein